MKVTVRTVFWVALVAALLAIGADRALPQTVRNGAIQFPEITAPGNPPADRLNVYVKDDAGTTKLCSKDSGGTEACGLGGGSVTITEDTFANQPATCSPGHEFYPTDNPNLRGYCPSTNTWKYLFHGLRTSLPPTTGWAFVNQASSTASTPGGTVKVVTPKSGTVTITAYCRSPATSINGDFRFTILPEISGISPGSAPTYTNAGFGIAFRESGTGKLVALRVLRDTNGIGLSSEKWTNPTTFSAVYTLQQSAAGGSVIAPTLTRTPSSLRLDLSDTTNIVFYWSMDSGTTWEQYDTRTKTDFFTTAPDEACMITYANGGRAVVELVGYTGN